jgi:protocatechuate 3,4-dioxygenase alpha subunit
VSANPRMNSLLGLAASQTVGPFFQIGFEELYQTDLTVPGLNGRVVNIRGQVFDGDRVPVPDAVIEIWQANSFGKYAHPEDQQEKPLDPEFTGFGRCPTDAEGRYAFRTVKPGRVPSSTEVPQAPHINVTMFMRGLLDRLVTRLYFQDEHSNRTDEILNLIDPARRPTLLARPAIGESAAYVWNVVLQGPDETVSRMKPLLEPCCNSRAPW